MTKILIIDDEGGHRLMVRAVMTDAGYDVDEAESGEDGLALIDNALPPDVVLLDIHLPGMDGMETLRAIRKRNDALPVVMLTAYGSVGSAVEAMKHGAFDYLTKPTDNDELLAVVNKAREYGRLLAENRSLRQQLSDRAGPPRLIGDSPSMREVRELINQVGPTEASVLILGESGTGKELVAEGLHAVSLRSNNPLIKVNCAALPAELLESELFGYVKGAFTGAVRDKPGRFQLAHEGTLFLDEIGEMPVALQAKLLRAIQERVVEPLGSVRPVETDVRILAATNRNLYHEIQAGRFREDLYFRLNVLEISIPPLRDRLDDLPLLVGFLLEKLGNKNRKAVRGVTPAFLDALSHYHWPGNVRELENVLERALILSRSDSIGPESLPPHIHAANTVPHSSLPASSFPSAIEEESGEASLDEAERQAILAALKRTGGHRERTATALGISRRTLQYKLKKFGLAKRRTGE
ncbi:sigma-54-dependent transcriptional regulator [Desulfovibrio inopinatus]|uniref:sigma-54-dependent transcriptional regulator n=1 Tax=Desulfovibrio inopinatus TaxID=102109 RepID=UPI0004277D0F|nr:sigma-54 dependent transcriptional regulator [Desulfovibrio inopinatus]